MSMKLAILFLLLFNCILPGQCEEPDIESTQLKGAIELSTKLPPIDEHLKTGKVFQKYYLPVNDRGNEWIQIPKWIAGIWQQKKETRKYIRNDITGEVDRQPLLRPAAAQMRWGWQRDREGNIWQFQSTRGLTKTRAKSNDIYGVRLAGTIESLSDNQVLNRVRVLSIYVDRTSGLITRCFQQEQLESIKPVDGTSCHHETSIRSYDENGNSRKTWLVESNLSRVSRFRPVSVYRGEYVSDLFKDFLKASGRKELIPH